MVVRQTVGVQSSLVFVCGISLLQTASAIYKELYTTNAICSRNNCINPIFPGMEDLHRLSQQRWTCSTLSKASPSLSFCAGAVNYDPSLPVPETGAAATLDALVTQQDNAAATAFFYHLSGMGLDAWDFPNPQHSDNECVRSIWRMTCFTYFPRIEMGCQDGMQSQYLRPCSSSCQNYIQACQVECCDESVQCVFEHSKEISPSVSVTTFGYAPHEGPSSMCTGASMRGAHLPGSLLMALIGGLHLAGLRAKQWAWLLPLVVAAATLQGCDGDVPSHTVGNWRGEPDFLIEHEFVPPGASPRDAVLNSCSLPSLSLTLQCSGRGTCKKWDLANVNNPLAFCECDRDWADPECRTRRKSQLVSYLLALFFGFLGADRFYLGEVGPGLMKLLTLGGGGVWWIIDIIRTGSAPVYAKNYRVADDLPHWAYVLITVMVAVLIGFGLAYHTTMQYKSRRRLEAMLSRMEEEQGAAWLLGEEKSMARPITGPGQVFRPAVPKSYGAVSK
mmetsp:Transcript_21/g.24  ORF Transcript_21/g.24 Transcript_21/m.24 type:complete len:503 (-) Transcript_21:111-1619(-)|eukprot:CAMPEP_0178414622 /NCGR_PEP_ID=MMETSP0689_2-20121128/23131_1 /TAXON_ID=160604 /ORGANISM="Amphidinium massartii, Strain CS-259" /LENGTH=502 /DNA_ID=CAMNT_0020035917 /DNA_START=131 /DNA_END=1639 /DNA_ORIENTATION=-